MRKTKSTSPVEKTKTVGISIRIEQIKNRKFSAILSLKGMTATDFFQNAIDEFIENNYRDAIEILNIDTIAGGAKSGDR